MGSADIGNVGKLLELFELEEDYTESELKLAYRDLVQVWHPDKFTHNDRLKERAEAKIKEINSAYSDLTSFLSSRRSPARKPLASEPGKTPYWPENGSPSFIKSVFHASDFTVQSNVAFAHALKLAVCARSRLNLLHVSTDREGRGISEFPKVRNTLSRWGVLNDACSSRDLKEEGFRYQKVIGYHDSPVASILHFLDEHPADITVLATHQRKGAQRMIHSSVAETVSRDSDGLTLFITESGNGFVSVDSGAVSLRRVLIPVDSNPQPAKALTAAVKLADTLGVEQCDFEILYVGESSGMPDLDIPASKWSWRKTSAQGGIIGTILNTASNFNADLIVMATAGHKGFLDALRGSTTEQVVRNSLCPLLAVPVTYRF